MQSSYIKNNYGEVFYAIVSAWRPATGLIVELGVLDGYSTLHLARGAKRIQEHQCEAKIEAYDLWEEYPYKHGSIIDVKQMLNIEGYEDFVSLKQGSAYEVHANYPDGAVSILHVDISNTGETVRKIMDLWDPKIDVGGLILFEGGTEERDEVEWMKKYDMEPMKPEIENNPIIQAKYVYGTYLKFPGLTVMLKKRI